MSLSSPPRRSRDRREPEWDDHDDRDGHDDNYWSRTGLRIYGSMSAPFRLGDGSHRLRALLLCALFVFSLFAARLVDLQIVRGDAVAQVAQNSRMVKVVQPAERGKIYDATGIALAQSVPARDITADPYLIDDPAEYAAKLSPVVGIPEATLIASMQRSTNQSGKEVRFAYLARKVTLEKWDAIKGLKLPGLYSEPASLRVYPSGSLAANVLGYTNANGDGVAGIEAKFNEELAGVDGSKTYERSATGGEIPTGTGNEIDPQPGSSYQLTINRDLQWVAQQQINASVKRFAAESATVVVMDSKTQRILALAQAPTSDPNDVSKRDPEHLKNHSVEQAFDPGSTGKVMTMAAVLEEGAAEPDTVFDVPNRLPRKNGDGKFQFRDDVDHPFYKMTLAGVLAQSSNIGTIQAAELIGAQKQYEYLKKFGFGSFTGLGLPTENPGELPPVEKWGDLTFPNVAYGQGYSTNAVQMASAFATIANGGVRVTPRIIDAKIDPDGNVERMPEGESTRVVSEETTKKLIPMMEQVVSDAGTAPVAAIDGYRVAGKTGTAQLYDPEANGGKGGYRGYVASFIGLAPADDPRLVVAVITRDPKREYFGGVTGGPVFKAVMSSALQMMQIPPSGSKSPELELHVKGSTKGGPWNWSGR
ncbi:MAG: penicillin-binding protein 2 [Candidatus Nanopelagicales bacterium]